MAISPIKLPRFNNFTDMIQKQPQLFERYWDDAMTQIETALNAVLELPEIQEALAHLDEATQAAQDAADNANAAATGITSESSLVNSFVLDGSFTAPLVQVDNTGAVTIASHVRRYGNQTVNPDVPVTGGTFASGATVGQTVRIYYTDPTRAGGAVAYQFTIDPTPPPVQGNNIHSVGAGTVPGAGSSDGNYVRPPGFVEP